MKASKLVCETAGTRTQDPYIKSVLLYQLSYGIEENRPNSRGFFGSAKISQKVLITNFLWNIFPQDSLSPTMRYQGAGATSSVAALNNKTNSPKYISAKLRVLTAGVMPYSIRTERIDVRITSAYGPFRKKCMSVTERLLHVEQGA